MAILRSLSKCHSFLTLFYFPSSFLLLCDS